MQNRREKLAGAQKGQERRGACVALKGAGGTLPVMDTCRTDLSRQHPCGDTDEISARCHRWGSGARTHGSAPLLTATGLHGPRIKRLIRK